MKTKTHTLVPMLVLTASLSGCYLTPESRQDCFEFEMDSLERRSRSSYDIHDELKRIQDECWMSDSELSEALLARRQPAPRSPGAIAVPAPTPVPDACRERARYAEQQAHRYPSLYTIEARTLSQVQSMLPRDQQCRVRATTDSGVVLLRGDQVMGAAINLESLARSYSHLAANGLCENRSMGFECSRQWTLFCGISVDGKLVEGPYYSEASMEVTWRAIKSSGFCR